MSDLAEQIVALLRTNEQVLTSAEISEGLEAPCREVDDVLWASPELFAWQPGHRWGLTAKKTTPRFEVGISHRDTRATAISRREPEELRALTLESGVVLRVSKRALDSQALFTVRSQGSDVELILNAAHELFADFPIPFTDEVAPAQYKALLELLLQAWALYEDSIPPGPEKRELEDVRRLWGRRALELMTEGE